MEVNAESRRDDRLYADFMRLNNELANMQRELAKKNAELTRLNDQKNQFLGIAAHDLRNPLGVVLAYSELLLGAPENLNEEQIEFITDIHSSSMFMLNMVNDFLDFSKIEAGKLDLDLHLLNLKKFTEERVKKNRVIADRKQISIEFEAPDNIPLMDLDEQKIEQVINNLIGNAIKFSPSGSKIIVSVIPHLSETVVSVADEGPGMSAEDCLTLFNPFEKGKNKGTAGEKSTGLGLAIVKKIVEGHGGSISVQSELGRGSTFIVVFPLSAIEISG